MSLGKLSEHGEAFLFELENWQNSINAFPDTYRKFVDELLVCRKEMEEIRKVQASQDKILSDILLWIDHQQKK